LRREYGCGVASGRDRVKMIECEHVSSKDKWEYKNQRIINRKSGKCVTYVEGSDEVALKKCTGGENQKWIISHDGMIRTS